MVIEYLRVHDFGGVRFYETTLHRSLNILRLREAPTIFSALRLIVCSKDGLTIPCDWVRESTRLEAGVRLEGQLCSVCATPCDGRLTLTVTDSNGTDITDRYLEALDHCAEQDDTDLFDGLDETAPLRLCRYRNFREWDTKRELSCRTQRITDTKTFRTHLNRYIKDFRPEPINSRKPYLIGITPQGAFEVLCPDLPGPFSLSQTEEKLFRYICFLNTARFWESFETHRDLHHEKKPLLIQNFLEHLDESTHLDHLLARTLELNRQILILTE